MVEVKYENPGNNNKRYCIQFKGITLKIVHEVSVQDTPNGAHKS